MGGVIGEFHHETMTIFLNVQREMIPTWTGYEYTMQPLNASLVLNRFTG